MMRRGVTAVTGQVWASMRANSGLRSGVGSRAGLANTRVVTPSQDPPGSPPDQPGTRHHLPARLPIRTHRTRNEGEAATIAHDRERGRDSASFQRQIDPAAFVEREL